MVLQNGGQVESIQKDKKILSINVFNEGGSREVYLQINGSSLSYLSINEALNLRDEINLAIKQATGI